MGPHEASLSYHGVMCQAGALALESQFKRLFGYFQYRKLVLSIESPGGTIDGLDYILRVMQKWAQEGRVVAVGTTFQCASAAAFLLAMGQWGQRRVDRNTFLLFHSARIDSSSMAAMTAAYSTNLSQALNNVDRRLLNVMVDKMLLETSGAPALADLVMARASFVNRHWKRLAAELTTFTSAADANRKPDWLKTVQSWKPPAADARKFVLELKKHLNLRLQRDMRMDLCEAYVLCLIDQIAGVLDADAAEAAPALEVFVPELVPQDRTVEVHDTPSSLPRA
jgi:ATP-dependent protease ClpP protease subunit